IHEDDAYPVQLIRGDSVVAQLLRNANVCLFAGRGPPLVKVFHLKPVLAYEDPPNRSVLDVACNLIDAYLLTLGSAGGGKGSEKQGDNGDKEDQVDKAVTQPLVIHSLFLLGR